MTNASGQYPHSAGDPLAPGGPPVGYWPPQRPYAYPYPRQSTSGWAIASFVLALACCAPLGVIFGIIALVKTRDSRQSGRGLAIAGLAISGASVLAWVLVGVIVTSAVLVDRGEVTGTTESGESVTVGECLNETPQSGEPGAAPGYSSAKLDCSQPHSDEVFAVLTLSHFPDSDSDDDKILKGCQEELRRYSPSASGNPNLQVVVQDPGTNWKYMNDHTAACFAHFKTNRVGSIKG
jgi:hypothetical protein